MLSAKCAFLQTNEAIAKSKELLALMNKLEDMIKAAIKLGQFEIRVILKSDEIHLRELALKNLSDAGYTITKFKSDNQQVITADWKNFKMRDTSEADRAAFSAADDAILNAMYHGEGGRV